MNNQRPTVMFIDDVCDQPPSEEQRRLMKRWWAKVKRSGAYSGTPFTTPDPLVKFMGVQHAD